MCSRVYNPVFEIVDKEITDYLINPVINIPVAPHSALEPVEQRDACRRTEDPLRNKLLRNLLPASGRLRARVLHVVTRWLGGEPSP